MYWHSVFNTIYYAVGSVAVVNLVALPMALLLNQKLIGLNIFRTVFYMPAILPAVAVVLVFRLILFPGTGLVSWILTKVGAQCDTTQVTCNPVDWLNNPRLTMPAVILVSAWGVGADTPDLPGRPSGHRPGTLRSRRGRWYDQLVQIPVHHAAPPDACHLLQRRHRTHRGIPGVHQAGDLRRWRGRHRRTEQSLLTTFWYVYVEGFDYFHMGLATAMAFGLFVLIPIFTALNFLGQKRWVFYQEERR